ncbi:LytTR family DNA-binding domain-containing protein [Tateyamaria sp.]|uniref:LytTR family DNA-binding domain-containing protein n=1 Tax=Tateyamaria sp. TaxID=1929288 RepID=UPI003B20D8C2
MWSLFAVGFVILSTGHPVTLPQFDSFWLRLSFWWLALALYLAISPFYALLTDGIWCKLFRGPIPLIFLSTPLLLMATYGAGAILTVLFVPGSPPFEVMTWQMNLRNIVVAHAFETIALLWLLPSMRARKAANDPEGRHVILAGRKVALTGILRVKAAEHYLEVHSESGVETVRERMATLLDQVDETDGIQTHRSHWVAKAQAVKLSGSNLRLVDGTDVPVARGRMEDVRQWLNSLEADRLAS